MGKRPMQPAAIANRFQLLGQSRDNLPSEERYVVDEAYATGLTHFYDGDFQPALKIFTKLQSVADNGRISYLVAVCQYRLGQVHSAQAALVDLLEKEPGHQAARIALVELYAANGDFAAAVEQVEYLKDESIEEDHQMVLDRLKLRLDKKSGKSLHRLSIEQGLRWNSNINAGPDKSEITAPDGTLFRLDEKDREKGDWGTTTHLYGWFRYDPQAYTSLFWDTTASLYHVHYFEHNQFNYSNVRLKTGPVWNKGAYVFSLPAGYRTTLYNGSLDSHELSINPALTYAFNKRWALKSAFFYGDRSYEDIADRPSDKVVRRFELKPILNLNNTVISAAVASLSASVRDTRLSFHGVDAILYARHRLTEYTRVSVRFKHRKKKYQGIYTGWFDKRQDATNTIHATVTRKLGKMSSVGASISWSKNHSNTELFEYERYTAGVNVAFKF